MCSDEFFLKHALDCMGVDDWEAGMMEMREMERLKVSGNEVQKWIDNSILPNGMTKDLD